MEQEVILRVENLKKYFPIKGGFFSKTIGNVKAVDGVSLEVRKGETLGIVGESGCGKSTTGRAILQLLKPTGGKVYFKDQDLSKLSKKEMRALRPKMQLIFQDPYSSLNPRMTVGQIIGEALIDHKMATKENLREKVLEVMDLCGLAEYQIDRFPHEFSGGQRQRIGIARALALDPEFIVADEPVSALDVSIQAQIINLLVKLQKEKGFSYMFISHDLSVVEHLCQRVGVMYLGLMVELADKDELFDNPLHPYTKALLSAIPIPDPTIKRDRIILTGDIPSPANPPKGCKFHTRCPYATDKCKKEAPEYREIKEGHFVACHRVGEI
ncbi:dipeptide ABC transporter ATP-binding protein [Clostridium paraputrificum]|uniref:ABC transporter ATP-binding protein n=1 Tax=Clostridium paraputrificum TaxID=29363 RepID=UPI0023305C5C|nr:dipeptide ABC transporter ATP-binding protein [Clostridium paraputrificum]MDB2090526.1 dipeptide ABC transporter ATP-binding protein [Clostridium paraputrificum]MDB2097614.1 dipeptide ABC transporter ATP-binding protein [Clostridium paraputrificum]